MKNMKKYEAPVVLVISRGDLDVICTSSDFELPIVPVDYEETEAEETEAAE